MIWVLILVLLLSKCGELPAKESRSVCEQVASLGESCLGKPQPFVEPCEGVEAEVAECALDVPEDYCEHLLDRFADNNFVFCEDAVRSGIL